MIRGAIAALVLAGARARAPRQLQRASCRRSRRVDDAGASSGVDAGTAATPTSTPTVTGSELHCRSARRSRSAQYISSCPSLVLNAQVFPQCGFRIHGTAIDPECLCQQRVPLPDRPPDHVRARPRRTRAATSNYDSVCQQAVTGGCEDLHRGNRSRLDDVDGVPDVREQLRQRAVVYRRVRVLSRASVALKASTLR